MPSRRQSLLAAALACLLPPRLARADETAWLGARQGRLAVLLRHAIAPGTGDPPGFRLDDCATQRLLSEAGRAQARAIGVLLRERGLAAAEVRSSAWCRCLETARLLGLGPVMREPALDSFFGDRAAGPARTATLREVLRGWQATAPLVLVTHQVNITALTGIVPASGEALLLHTGERAGEVALRVAPPAI